MQCSTKNTGQGGLNALLDIYPFPSFPSEQTSTFIIGTSEQPYLTSTQKLNTTGGQIEKQALRQKA